MASVYDPFSNIAFSKATLLWSTYVCSCYNSILFRIPTILKIQETIKINRRKTEVHSFIWKIVILLSHLEKLLLKLCLFTLKNSITNHSFIHNHETHNLNKKFVHNYHKLSRVFTQAYLPPSAFSNPTPAVKEATDLKQVHTVNIGPNGFNYIFLRKLDISQLQSGSNLITFIQYCTQVYKPCL